MSDWQTERQRDRQTYTHTHWHTPHPTHARTHTHTHHTQRTHAHTHTHTHTDTHHTQRTHTHTHTPRCIYNNLKALVINLAIHASTLRKKIWNTLSCTQLYLNMLLKGIPTKLCFKKKNLTTFAIHFLPNCLNNVGINHSEWRNNFK